MNYLKYAELPGGGETRFDGGGTQRVEQGMTSQAHRDTYLKEDET